MKNKYHSLSLFLILCCASSSISFSQELDEFAEEDAYFFTIGKYYRSINPIITQEHDWNVWETKYDSAQKFQRAQKVIELLNLIYEEGIDDDGEIYGDTLDFYPSNLHFLDYNNDGFEDLIFEQQISAYRGHKVKVYMGDGEFYNLEFQFTGMIVAMGIEETTKALWFTLYDYPCCDGYIHTLESYKPVKKNETISYQLAKVEKYVESNTARNGLPEKFGKGKAFNTATEVVVLYRGRQPVYKTFVPKEGYKRKFKTYYPFAIIPKNTTGVVLSEIVGETRTGNDTVVFVRFNAELVPSKAMTHLVRKSYNAENNQIERSCPTTYYGWMDKNDLVIED